MIAAATSSVFIIGSPVESGCDMVSIDKFDSQSFTNKIVSVSLNPKTEFSTGGQDGKDSQEMPYLMFCMAHRFPTS